MGIPPQLPRGGEPQHGWWLDKNVLVHGAGTAQLALAAGVLDKLEAISSRCSSAKAPSFDHLDPEYIDLGRSPDDVGAAFGFVEERGVAPLNHLEACVG
jgi:hypothetical protein